MPRETVESLKLQIAAREANILTLNERLNSANARAEEMKERIAGLENLLTNEQEKAASDKRILKKQLAMALEDNARLRGYCDRVVEDDHVREIGPMADVQPKPAQQTTRLGPLPAPRLVRSLSNDEMATLRGPGGRWSNELQKAPPEWHDL